MLLYQILHFIMIYFENQSRDAAIKDTLVTKTVVDSNGTKIANFDFVVEDYKEPPANTLHTNSTARIPG